MQILPHHRYLITATRPDTGEKKKVQALLWYGSTGSHGCKGTMLPLCSTLRGAGDLASALSTLIRRV
jgi:hypothetical protein